MLEKSDDSLVSVRLIKTPLCDQELFDDVYELLDSFEGPLVFHKDTFRFSLEEFPFLEDQGGEEDILLHMLSLLSWEEIFSLCEHFRLNADVNEQIFVVLLTEKHNVNNFFSIYDGGRNIFVQTSGWDAFTFANPKFPIAYEIVGNVMDCLMNIPLVLPSPWIHQKPLGCMNDYCENKNDVILKLRTGDICQSCLSKIKEEGVNDGIVNQVIRIFETIRTQHLFKQGFIGNMRPLPVFIDDSGKLHVNNREIRLNPIESTLFIFFLMNANGISLNDLSLHKETLLNIYRIIRPAGNETAINELIRPYHAQGTFSVNKARLNSNLRRRIGEPLANFYLIERDSDNIFKINIDPANVKWGEAWRNKEFTISR